MSERPRFTIELTIHDNHGVDTWSHAIGCDDALAISYRAVDELKAGFLTSMDSAVRLMKTRELRREILLQTACRLAAQMADRLEDSEGWHDPDRIEPARRALGITR